jgi:hypothetical protein
MSFSGYAASKGRIYNPWMAASADHRQDSGSMRWSLAAAFKSAQLGKESVIIGLVRDFRNCVVLMEKFPAGATNIVPAVLPPLRQPRPSCHS